MLVTLLRNELKTLRNDFETNKNPLTKILHKIVEQLSLAASPRSKHNHILMRQTTKLQEYTAPNRVYCIHEHITLQVHHQLRLTHRHPLGPQVPLARLIHIILEHRALQVVIRQRCYLSVQQVTEAPLVHLFQTPSERPDQAEEE